MWGGGNFIKFLQTFFFGAGKFPAETMLELILEEYFGQIVLPMDGLVIRVQIVKTTLAITFWNSLMTLKGVCNTRFTRYFRPTLNVGLNSYFFIFHFINQ